MRYSPLTLPKSEPAPIPVQDMPKWVAGWLLSCDIASHSRATIAVRTVVTDKLVWYLQTHGHEVCGVDELRGFFYHMTHGHEKPGGRWGVERLNKPPRPGTVVTYHRHLRRLFRWISEEMGVHGCAMDRIPIPVHRPDQIRPFDAEELRRLILAAKASQSPVRDEAIVRMLYDTGLRASEIVSIRIRDLELAERRVSVLGKGNKRRTVAFGARTGRALWRYVSGQPVDRFLFRGQRGPITRSGLLHICRDLGAAASVPDCHPHRFRHSFAIEFLRQGGNTFTLQTILGHTCLSMTQRYVAIAQADVEVQQRRHSPGDKL